MERLWTPSENRRRLSSPAFIVTLVIAWFAIPILMGLVYAPLHSRWLIQETPRLWVAIAVAAVVWFSLAAIPLVFAGRMRPSLQELGGLLAAGALAGGFIASTGFILVNCIGVGGARQPMEFEQVPSAGRTVRLRAVADPIAGMTFEFGVTKLPRIARRSIDVARFRYQGRIRRGRLGLWWVEFLDRDDKTGSAAQAH